MQLILFIVFCWVIRSDVYYSNLLPQGLNQTLQAPPIVIAIATCGRENEKNYSHAYRL